MKNKKYNYLQVLVFYIVMNFFAGYLITFFIDIKQIYSSLNLPNWAPPTWAFGVAWTINNILVLNGNLTTLNLPHSLIRNRLLWLQGLSWVNYLVFQWVSFGLYSQTQIPSLFFWPTFSMLVLTLASVYYANQLDKKYKTKIIFSFITLIPWLLVASSLGLFVMQNN